MDFVEKSTVVDIILCLNEFQSRLKRIFFVLTACQLGAKRRFVIFLSGAGVKICVFYSSRSDINSLGTVIVLCIFLIKKM